MKIRFNFLALLALFFSFSISAAPVVTHSITSSQIKTIEAQAPNLNPAALSAAIPSYEQARAKGLDPQQILTVVDFSKPSTEQRFYVINFKTNKVLFNTLVSHGKNSGEKFATQFSNEPHRNESSLGLYLTKYTYYGNDGYDLLLQGLTPGFNTNAQQRAIIVHGARYVSPEFAQKYGYIGRSWGCFALEMNLVKPIINTIKEGTLIFAYAPQPAFLHSVS